MRSGAGDLPELTVGLVDPHPIKDDAELAGERDLSSLGAPPLHDVHHPGLASRHFATRVMITRDLEQRNPYQDHIRARTTRFLRDAVIGGESTDTA